MTRSCRQILLAVQPRVLEGALAVILSAHEEYEIAEAGWGGRQRPTGRYDAAIVSRGLARGVQADVVLTLPDHSGKGGGGAIAICGVVQQVSIRDVEGLIELLQEAAPMTSYDEMLAVSDTLEDCDRG